MQDSGIWIERRVVAMMRSAWLSGVLIAACAASDLHAQAFPSKPIRIIVPSVAGGGTDITARTIAPKMSEILGQQVVVENRAGAAMIIGSEAVARAAPDGHTLLMGISTMTINPFVYKKLPYDTVRDFAPISQIVSLPNVLVVHPSLPSKTVKDFVALAKARPGTLNYASSGNGTIVHLVAEVFAARAHIDIVHVPYKAIAAVVTDLVGGHVPTAFGSLPAAWAQVEAGRLRALAVTTGERSELVPKLPTLAEAGLDGIDVSTWWGLFAPGKTPKDIVARLNAEVQKIVVTDEVKARLTAEGAQAVTGMTSEAFGALIRNEIAMWRRIAQERGLKGE